MAYTVYDERVNFGLPKRGGGRQGGCERPRPAWSVPTYSRSGGEIPRSHQRRRWASRRLGDEDANARQAPWLGGRGGSPRRVDDRL